MNILNDLLCSCNPAIISYVGENQRRRMKMSHHEHLLQSMHHFCVTKYLQHFSSKICSDWYCGAGTLNVWRRMFLIGCLGLSPIIRWSLSTLSCNYLLSCWNRTDFNISYNLLKWQKNYNCILESLKGNTHTHHQLSSFNYLLSYNPPNVQLMTCTTNTKVYSYYGNISTGAELTSDK